MNEKAKNQSEERKSWMEKAHSHVEREAKIMKWMIRREEDEVMEETEKDE